MEQYDHLRPVGEHPWMDIAIGLALVASMDQITVIVPGTSGKLRPSGHILVGSIGCG
jgi:hypothetical protein